MKLTDDISFKHKGYLWLAGTLAGFIIVGYLFYSVILTPQLDARDQTSNQLMQERAKVAQVENFAAAHPDSRQYLLKLDQKIAQMDTLLPDRANLGQALAFLESTAENTGTVLARFGTSKSVYNNNGWTETRVAFRVVGSYGDLLEYARRLDASPRFMAVEAVDFDHRVMLNRAELDQPGVQDLVEKKFSGDAGVVFSPVIDRGLLRKPSLLSMNINLVIVTQGQLPGAEVTQGQSALSKT